MRAVAANLLMDMVEQCRLITHLHDQKNTRERRVGVWPTTKAKLDANRLVKELEAACEELKGMDREAVKEGIHKNIMDGILSRNLPPAVYADFYLEVAA